MSGNRPTVRRAPDLPIVADGVVVELMVPSDAEGLSAYRSDPEVARLQSWSVPWPVAEAERLIAEAAEEEPFAVGSWAQLAVREHAGAPLVGDVYVAVPIEEPGIAEVGVTLATTAQGRGLATRAVGAVVGELLQPGTGVGVVRAYVHVDNMASLALFDRLGFTRLRVEADEVRLERTA